MPVGLGVNSCGLMAMFEEGMGTRATLDEAAGEGAVCASAVCGCAGALAGAEAADCVAADCAAAG